MTGQTDVPSPLDLRAVVREGQGRWVLDPAGSTVEFHVKHFWGAITVHGRFGLIGGGGTVTPDGTLEGRVEIEASSLTTKNRRRDEHLRSADFFDVAQHPKIVVLADGLTPAGSTTMDGQIVLEAAGKRQSIPLTVELTETAADTVTLRSELVVDRTAFGMIWSPLGMASREARAIVTARFIRQ